MPGQAALMVPVHLDALVLAQDRAVVDTMVDFTRLPYFDGTRDVHSDVGYLSEAVVASAFPNQDLRLPAGVHLHWALPDALTRARSTSESLAFPPVPNRWLVLRGRADGPQAYEKAWLVYSDYLYPAGEGAGSGSAPYPLAPAAAGTSPPYRYLGRVVGLGEEPADQPGSGWLSGLTAVGYGDPLFAAFYPNCRNVFGLHDGEIVETPAGLRYDVVGWYADGAQDYLAALVEEAAGTDPREVIRRLAGWAVPDQPVPARMLCYARLEFTGDTAGRAPAGAPVAVAVGSTGGQALGAYLADVLGEPPAAPDPTSPAPAASTTSMASAASPAPAPPAAATTSTIEDQLAAILLAPQVPPDGLDADARLAAAVHESGFTAVSAGPLWTLSRAGNGSGPTAGGGAPADALRADRQATLAGQLPPELAPVVDRLNHAVHALNLAQQTYDRATEQIGSLCDQLFADWYRYMLCAYPPAGTGEDYPAIDDVRGFIERRTLPELNRRVAAAGVAAAQQDPSGAGYPVAVDGNPDSAAAALALAATDARTALDALNGSPALREAGLAYRLQQVAAPRFWEPTEPVVLLAGEAMTATLRHGQDGRARPDGLLDCQIASNAPISPQTADDAAALVRLIDGLRAADGGAQIGYQTWDAQAWDPLLLAWEVEVLPTAGGQAQAGEYRTDLLLAGYALAEDEPELRWRDGQGTVRDSGMVYTGTSILAPHAQDLYLRRLCQYIMGIYQREQGLPALSDVDAVAFLADGGNLQRLLDWQQAKPQPAGGAPDPVGTALRAVQHVQATPSLAQSLGGFNDALLARRQTLQLEVADPTGFDDYRRFSDQVRAYVQGGGATPPYLRGHNRSAPQPDNDFSPLRNGALRLRRLRLLDTFGRAQDPQWTKVRSARQMPVSGNGDLIALPPRVVQPGRLAFRWLSADMGDMQLTELATETPICGWVLANHLDESLMFHDADGTALGALDRDGGWQFAPGGTQTTPEQIADPHLRALVGYLRTRDASLLRALHGALDSALENIDPAGPAGQDATALLVGRPLAVVRAALSLELRGLPAVSQGWPELRADLARDTRQSRGFTAVRVPVRIGDYRRLGDGLVGYWREAGDGYQDTFYAPLSEPVDHPSIRTHADGEAAFELSWTAPAETLTMLVDPRGAVHATCGVLPVKSVDIPAEQYADALRRIEVTFTAGPLLVAGSALDLPLPDEPGASWSWLERTAAGWQETGPWPTVDRPAFQEQLAAALWQRLLDPAVRWLRAVTAASTTAEVVVVPERVGAPGPFAATITAALDEILAGYAARQALIPLPEFTSAVTETIGAPAWDRLCAPDVGWLDPLDVAGTARVTPAAAATPGAGPTGATTGSAGAAGGAAPAAGAPGGAELPDPLTGMASLIRSTLDLCQRRIVPPGTGGWPAGPQRIREGWLKLSRLE